MEYGERLSDHTARLRDQQFLLASFGAILRQPRERQALTNAIRFLGVLAEARGVERKAAEMFVSRWPKDSAAADLREQIKTGEVHVKAVVAANTTTPAWAGVLARPAILTPLLENILRETAASRAGFLPVPPTTPVPYRSTGATMKWVVEGGKKPASQLALGALTLSLFKAASILIYTNDLMRAIAAGAEDVFAAQLTHDAVLFLDTQLLNPAVAAVASTNPASLTNTGTLVAEKTTLADTIAEVVKVFYASRPAVWRPTWILSPSLIPRIRNSVNNPTLTSEGGDLLGYKAIVTPGAGQVLTLLDAAAVVFHEQLAIDTSETAAVEMETTPGAPGPNVVLRDLWSNNETGVMLDAWTDYKAEPNSVAYAVITP